MQQTYIIAFRHGETDMNISGDLQGCTINYSLNKNGENQADRLAIALHTEIEAIRKELACARLKIQLATSPLLRADQTGKRVRAALETTVTQSTWYPTIITEDLRERNFGIFEGRPSKELTEHPGYIHYKSLTTVAERLRYQVHPSIETDHQIVTRCTNFADPLITRFSNEEEPHILLLSTHSSTLTTLLRSIHHSTDTPIVHNCSHFRFTTDQWLSMLKVA